MSTTRPGSPPEGGAGAMTLENTVSDRAQATTIAFDALAFMTGSLCADSFYPPGKVADFFGFQYLRDNDPTGLGHNTAFAGTVGDNVLYILNDEQVGQLAELAVAQVGDINAYAYARFPLMESFRRLLTGDVPEGSTGLSAAAVAEYSASVYAIDGQISFARAQAYAEILSSLSQSQEEQLAQLAGTGVGDWPDRSGDPRLEAWRRDLDSDAHVALTTFAGDLFSWYVGDLASDTYFCPERQGTYFGSFYMKDIPAMLSQQAGTDVSIQENLTGEYGNRLLDTLTAAQRATIEGLVDGQRPLLQELVDTRTAIAAQLRTLWDGSDVNEGAVQEAVLTLSERYGELDGQIVSLYVTAFKAVYDSLTPEQAAALWESRQGTANLNLNASFGDPCSLHPEDLAYLHSQAIDMPDITDTDFLFQP